MSVYREENEKIIEKRAPENSVVYITKTKEYENLVFGWANIALKKDGTFPHDWQDDITLPEVLERAAYQFVLKYRATGEMHQGETKGYLIESMMFTKEKQQVLGISEGIVPEGWWVGFYIPDDEVFEKVKSGKYKMFSIEGKARRIPSERGEELA